MEKIVLGLNLFHADSSACLIVNNELISAAEEERFTRVKHYGGIPSNAIKFCLISNGYTLNDVDIISINQNISENLFEKFKYLFSKKFSLKLVLKSLKIKKKRQDIKHSINNLDIGTFKGKIIGIEHHLSHVCSSFNVSGFKNATCLSVDGFGDFVSTAWGYGTNENVFLEDKVYFPHSLGVFYQSITQYLGFNNYGDEYKVMGLAPYGKPIYTDKLNNLIKYTGKGKFELNLEYFTHHKNDYSIDFESNGYPVVKTLYSNRLCELLGSPRKTNEKIEQFHKDIASSAQKIYEDIFFKILNFLFEKYKNQNLSLSGGCIMNSVANGKIRDNTNFTNIYIPSAPGDAGGAIGSSFAFLSKTNKIKFKHLHAYWGPKFTNDEIKKEIENLILNKGNPHNLNIKLIENEDDLNDFVSSEIQNNKVIGWFQGKMEFGARALGNRSILANPANPKIKELINKKIKLRETFRPFAPSILSEDVEKWFGIYSELPFMSEVKKIKSNKNLIPGVVHIDDTCRLQTVKKEENKKFYNLIHKFKQKTGIPILLNTSFNENEPIVCSPKDAIKCFLRTEMDIICIENWVISR